MIGNFIAEVKSIEDLGDRLVIDTLREMFALFLVTGQFT